ncbi:MAG: peptide chain release factor N(5)-glutamine methyltransferase [Muribaculaceae bacterium]|nr:peptide chain release factor N(5)-glutamine methyltransferase [Muribaculaceae bacterium]
MEETLRKLRKNLEPIYGKGESEAIIRLIFSYVKGWRLTDMLIHQKEELSDFVKKEIDQILERLLKYEPIQYITGETRFYGMDMKIKPGVLIPRPETEELADLIIEENRDREDLHVLDLCTGSGCLAIALARNLPFSKVTAVDFSEEAVEVAKENSEKLKTRVKVVKADIFESQNFSDSSDKFDIIVSNPPYVMDKEALHMERNVLDYEPHEAIFVRDDEPLRFYIRIADIAKEKLKIDGKLYLEINPLLSEEMMNLLKSKGFEDIRILRDSFGKNRFAACLLI